MHRIHGTQSSCDVSDGCLECFCAADSMHRRCHWIHALVQDAMTMKSSFISVTAPVAQLDRASGFEPEGREFESLRAHHYTGNVLGNIENSRI